MASGDTTMTLQSTTGLPTGTGITLTIDATDPVSGLPTPLLEETITGVVSSSTVTSLLRGKDGTTAQAHASGANVVMLITANLWNDWQTAYLLSHTQAGKIYATSPQVLTGINDINNNQVLGISATSSAVNSLELTNNVTGSAPVLSAVGSDTNISMNLVPKGTGNVQVNGNPVWQYLGYAQITADFTLSASQTTPTQVTGLTSTVTIPTGVTKVKITAYTYFLKQSTSTDNVELSIWDGTVNSGTQLQGGVYYAPTNNYGVPATIVAIEAPAAGSKTYNVGIVSSASTNVACSATSTTPAFILVECC